MRRLAQFLLIFLAVTGAVVLAASFTELEFGTTDFWQRHGAVFLVLITLFPRLTLLFSSVPFGGVFWWLGFLFAPRILVAMLATLTYWSSNPILVTLAWLVALGGESSEKYVIVQRGGSGRGFRQAKWVKSE